MKKMEKKNRIKITIGMLRIYTKFYLNRNKIFDKNII